MPMSASEITGMITAALPGAVVEMTDLAGDNDHWAAKVTAPQFVGKNRVQQHKMVYEALDGRMGGVLHALQLTTAVPTSD
ncbi:MAG: BolA/IbaG family iron-sulfur metabolism protein [Altererythrobacter sp.]|uniref:BolA/IbaG family iron-sulfur metabolism protein n=1 Tax=uncultured Altererythrobacter sp. TaxID=500840 RepID=UPI00179DC191|nr:BolA/IbaG family iron-sulfur metabolism protein [uncultured Altererythrobacter sp.]MBT8389108.1 BolA/IbaG family iron-sulfur metabolism protein [Altererythrobacter sp.]NNE49120.1 BolA family transcriptional regulator [Altererythrobacter sp.]